MTKKENEQEKVDVRKANELMAASFSEATHNEVNVLENLVFQTMWAVYKVIGNASYSSTDSQMEDVILLGQLAKLRQQLRDVRNTMSDLQSRRPL